MQLSSSSMSSIDYCEHTHDKQIHLPALLLFFFLFNFLFHFLFFAPTVATITAVTTAARSECRGHGNRPSPHLSVCDRILLLLRPSRLYNRQALIFSRTIFIFTNAKQGCGCERAGRRATARKRLLRRRLASKYSFDYDDHSDSYDTTAAAKPDDK